MKLEPQVFVSETKPEPEKIDPVSNERFWKPLGGLWTSTLDDEGGDWVRWLTGEGYTLDMPRWGGSLWVLTPAEANIAVIDTPHDLVALHEQYPLAHGVEGVRSFRYMVDWEALSRDYDGMHVPNPWTYRFGWDLDSDDGGLGYDTSMFFYVMDAESTCWFRWCFEGEPQLLELKKGVKS